MRLTCELNAKYHTGEEIREIFLQNHWQARG